MKQSFCVTTVDDFSDTKVHLVKHVKLISKYTIQKYKCDIWSEWWHANAEKLKDHKCFFVFLSITCFYLYAFLRDLCGRDRFLTSYMRHYVFRYTIQEVLTLHVWQLYEQMVSPLFFLFVVEGAFKNVSN